MFLRRNKGLAVLFLAALVFLSGALGLERLSWDLPNGPDAVDETTMTMAGVTEVTAETESIWTSETAYPPTDGTTAHTSPTMSQPEPNPREPFWLSYELARLLALGCALAALLLAGLFCWVGKEELPLLGPDGGVLALGLLWGLTLLLRSLFWYPTWAMFAVGAVFGGVGLILLRSMAQWLKHGAPWAWVGCHRLGLRLSHGRARRYAETEISLILLAGAVLGWLLFWMRWWPGVVVAAAGWFPVRALVLLGKSADDLDSAAGQVCAGQEPRPGTGFFSCREEELSRLHQAHAEAVQKAVTGERFKVELISNVSHDLRTPLTAIMGYGELLQKEHLSPEGETQLAQLNRKAGYMKDLVDDLFELTKVSSGVSEPNMARIDLIRLLEQTMGLLDDRFQAAGLTVKRHYASNAQELTTDGSRMHQVFVNLMENAIKYALPGSRLHLYVRGGTVRLTNVASYEMDFSADEIVERFARGDKARSSQGSGIGLAIAQTYTQSVGGTFRVEIDGDQFSAIVELPL